MGRLRDKWPEAKIKHIGNSKQENYSYEWRIREGGKILEGEFDADESAVALDGDINIAVAFAIWFRSIVLADQDLLLYDQGCSMRIALKPGITPHDLALRCKKPNRNPVASMNSVG